MSLTYLRNKNNAIIPDDHITIAVAIAHQLCPNIFIKRIFKPAFLTSSM